MHELTFWCGFFGAWLLFAGPVYQAALELEQEQRIRTEIEAALQRATLPPRPSRWWWLLPPVGFVRSRRYAQQQRNAMIEQISPQHLAELIRYLHKATGWALVALGAFLIAVKETAELVEHVDGPWWVAVVAVLGMATLAALYTAVRIHAGQSFLAAHAG